MEDIDFLECLSNHSKLRQRFESILGIAENESGCATTADEAERLAVQAVRGLGQELLQEWAVCRMEEEDRCCERNPELDRDGKKNSIGTVVLDEFP